MLRMDYKDLYLSVRDPQRQDFNYKFFITSGGYCSHAAFKNTADLAKWLITTGLEIPIEFSNKMVPLEKGYSTVSYLSDEECSYYDSIETQLPNQKWLDNGDTIDVKVTIDPLNKWHTIHYLNPNVRKHKASRKSVYDLGLKILRDLDIDLSDRLNEYLINLDDDSNLLLEQGYTVDEANKKQIDKLIEVLNIEYL